MPESFLKIVLETDDTTIIVEEAILSQDGGKLALLEQILHGSS